MVWLHRLLLAIITAPVKWLVRANTIPSDIESELGIDKTKPIIYLLRTNSLTDQIALGMSASAIGLPAPNKPLIIDGNDYKSCVFLKQPKSVFKRKQRHEMELIQKHGIEHITIMHEVCFVCILMFFIFNIFILVYME